MDKRIKIYLLLLLFLSLIHISYSSIEIDSCREINESILDGDREIRLNQDVLTTGTCFEIKSNNIIFDCQNNLLDGDDSGIDYGFYLNGVQNVTIKNCIISNFNNGIFLDLSNYNKFENITSLSNYNGFNSDSSSYNNITNSRFSNNQIGVYYIYSSLNNYIYNSNISSNNYYGILFSTSYNNIIEDSLIYNSGTNDIYNSGSSFNDIFCNNEFKNVQDDNGKYHFYYNHSVHIDSSWSNVSSIFLCNADYSEIKDIQFINNLDKKGAIISLTNTDYSNFSNIYIENYFYGFWSIFNKYNLYENITTKFNNKAFYSYQNSDYSKYNNINILNNEGVAFQAKGRHNDFTNIYLFNNSNNGFFIYSSSYNQIINLTSVDNTNHGIIMGYSYNNYFENINSSNNLKNGQVYGIYIYNSYSNTFNNFSLIGNNRGIGISCSNGNSYNNKFFNGIIQESTKSEITIEDPASCTGYVRDNEFKNLSLNTHGFNIINSYGNKIENIKENVLSSFLNLGEPIYCNNYFNNISNLNTGKYFFYSNNTINIDNWSNVSSIFLCNADNSQVKNLNLIGNNRSSFIYSRYSDNLNLSNITLRDYLSGYVVRDSNNNYLSNLNVDVSSSSFMFLNVSFSYISNSIFNSKSSYAVYLALGSDNNKFFNSSFFSQGSYELYFSNTKNNIMYNNNLTTSSRIYNNNWAAYPNSFNYTIPGIGNIGNYWSDLTCTKSKWVNDIYKVCTNSSNYTINVANNIYDYAPLTTLTPPIVTIPLYIIPTPADNAKLNKNFSQIKVNFNGNIITSCNINFLNGSSYPMDLETTFCSINITSNSENEVQVYQYNVSFEVESITYYLENRIFTLYSLPSNKSNDFPGFGIGSIFTLIFTLFVFRKNKF